jgi:hypothetical protein
MSDATASAHDAPLSFGIRLRHAAVAAAFALVLVIPKILSLRRSPRSWMAFRILLAISGAAVVVLPLGLWNNYLFALVGLAMFNAAILLPAAKPQTTASEKARQLGALVVVNGGRYQPGNGPACLAQLFVGHENIWALDSYFQPLLVVPVAAIVSADAEAAAGLWLLRIRWDNRDAEFLYRGVFAEHLARVAESTLRSVMRPTLPVIPQRRAASA